ncbi:MAG: aconitate hydratase AcnA [Phycisphaerales bacterium]|nr:aconitate hydratase AcnA [Phycisphaerales bacterium]
MTRKAPSDAFGSRGTLATRGGPVTISRLAALETVGLCRLERLPYSIRVLLENVLRNVDGFAVTDEHVRALAAWSPAGAGEREVPFTPARVILQDFTGVPCVVDLAAMRSAMQRLGGDPARINPQCPVDLVIDHSVQVDYFGRPDALDLNAKIEFQRNRERYEFLRWGQKAFANFRVVPPATGIVHQVNLEYLAKVVMRMEVDGAAVAMPDTLVGTDSHTTMINGLGVLGWGVGGIEAEAAMLGQPMYMLVPQVVGFRLTGKLREGATATDLVLRVTEMLRKLGVVDKFVEFFGEGLETLSVADRATIANMAPEYGATMGYFPVDERTLDYLRLTGRSDDEVELVETYCKAQGLFRIAGSPDPQYTTSVELDLSTVEPALAGPRRPQDRVNLGAMKSEWHRSLAGLGKKPSADKTDGVDVRENGNAYRLGHGDVVIAAITSCTNTSNPSVMVAAGLLARKAVERGLRVQPWVKTSLAPGSRVVTDYLEKAGLTPFLEQLGFHTVGYGCTTCIGSSGPLPAHIRDAVLKGDLVVASVLSGNRNFEARINPHIKANYLASPPLVVAYAIAGTVDRDLATEPLGRDGSGQPVYLRDVWPTQGEIADAVSRCVDGSVFRRRYADVFTGPPEWQKLPVGEGLTYNWDEASTYIQEPPYFVGLPPVPPAIAPIRGARCLAMFGDSITTDHISPAGEIDPRSPAGQYLVSLGIERDDFNSYGSRRGNDRVMTRGTFANPRIRNLLAPGTEGGQTIHLPTGIQMSIYDAAMKYREAQTPLIVLAGKDYGMGSSRDWAAKGTMLLGVRAVIAVSFERIHRANLVGMGVLPLQFLPGQSPETLHLTGVGFYDIPDLGDNIQPGQVLTVIASKPDEDQKTEFQVRCRLDTPVDIAYYRHGGVLPLVLRNLLKE